MNFEGMSSVFFILRKCISRAICGVPENLIFLLFVLDVWFWWYLWWPDNFLTWSFAFRSRLWMVFVVAGHAFAFSCFSSEVHFECYLWCSRAFGYLIVCLGSLILMVFVVAGPRPFFKVFVQKSILSGICRGRRYSWKLQLEIVWLIFIIFLWF